MKTTLALIALFSMTSAFANGRTPLKNGDLAISGASGKIVSVREICPPTPGGIRCMAVGSVVTVQVALNGCLDRLGGFTYNYDTSVYGKNRIYFSAINIANKASATVRCVKAPTTNVTLSVPFEGDMELVNLDFFGTANR